jgi:hypothetical protein
VRTGSPTSHSYLIIKQTRLQLLLRTFLVWSSVQSLRLAPFGKRGFYT